MNNMIMKKKHDPIEGGIRQQQQRYNRNRRRCRRCCSRDGLQCNKKNNNKLTKMLITTVSMAMILVLGRTSTTMTMKNSGVLFVSALQLNTNMILRPISRSSSISCSSMNKCSNHRLFHSSGTSSRRSNNIIQREMSFSYGRGAEIWPELPSDEKFLLQDSFPNGVLPNNVRRALERQQQQLTRSTSAESLAEEDDDDDTNNNNMNNKNATLIRRILRKAANTQKRKYFSPSYYGADKNPIALISLLCLRGWIKPLDFLLVAFISGYFVILSMIAKSTRYGIDNDTSSSNNPIENKNGLYTTTNNVPILPALPPQGHVPYLVSNPLGYNYINSPLYNRWLKLGAFLGFLCPVLLLFQNQIPFLGWFLQQKRAGAAALASAATTSKETIKLASTAACARPLFFLCCQALTEAMSKKYLTPLPIKILIPICYNTIRIGYLWNWCYSSSSTTSAIGGAFFSRFGNSLAVLNFFYWMINLFGFLLPIATMKYMRSYFYHVEAEQVITRKGME